MKTEIKTKFIASLLLIALLIPSFTSAALEFTPEQRDAHLNWFEKLKQNVFKPNLLTAAGQERGCSINPDESGLIKQGSGQDILCSNKPALINLYFIDSQGGWHFAGEYESPIHYTTSAKNPYDVAWECYYCPSSTSGGIITPKPTSPPYIAPPDSAQPPKEIGDPKTISDNMTLTLALIGAGILLVLGALWMKKRR